ncbi:hypothetical protein DL93DRAFT_2070722, partial [Clavulina sp. PMI_390]
IEGKILPESIPLPLSPPLGAVEIDPPSDVGVTAADSDTTEVTSPSSTEPPKSILGLNSLGDSPASPVSIAPLLQIVEDATENSWIAEAAKLPPLPEDEPGEFDVPRLRSALKKSSSIKTPRSPRGQGVTFNSDNTIVEAPVEDNGDDAASELLSGSPEAVATSLHDPPPSANTKSKLSEEAARIETRNKEEVYQQAFTALEEMTTGLSKDALDTVAEAFVDANIHASLVKTIDHPVTDDWSTLGAQQCRAMRIICSLSAATDHVRLSLIQADNLLEKLRMHLESSVSVAQESACSILQGLLYDEGDDDEVMDAVLEGNFVPSLAKYME